MSSQPAARPFFSFFPALTTSSNVGSSVHISMSGVAAEEAALSSGHTVPAECLIIVFTPSFENFFNSRALRAVRSVYWGLKAREVISNDYSHSPENRTDLASTCIHFSFRSNFVEEDILVMPAGAVSVCHLSTVLQCTSLAGHNCHNYQGNHANFAVLPYGL